MFSIRIKVLLQSLADFFGILLLNEYKVYFFYYFHNLQLSLDFEPDE
jgi:hypothetical protein